MNLTVLSSSEIGRRGLPSCAYPHHRHRWRETDASTCCQRCGLEVRRDKSGAVVAYRLVSVWRSTRAVAVRGPTCHNAPGGIG